MRCLPDAGKNPVSILSSLGMTGIIAPFDLIAGQTPADSLRRNGFVFKIWN